MEFLLFIIGLVLLIKAADFFVDAATYIAKALNIPEIIIGATMVSIGTTLPEVMVSATSALKGLGDIAYGNAIGSIICNTSLIAAISLIFAPGKVDVKALKIPAAFFFTVFIYYAVVAIFFEKFTRLSGIILLLIFVAYAAFIIISETKRGSRSSPVQSCKEGSRSSPVQSSKEGSHSSPVQNSCGRPEGDTVKDTKAIFIKILILLVSAIVIAFASNLLVDNGTLIAKRLGVPDSVVGLTMIALGTSLPELSTAITSLVKGHSNLSLGNIIGANFFNLVLVSGIAITLEPFSIPSSNYLWGINSTLVVDLPIALIVMLILCFPAIRTGKTRRWQGIVLICIYFAFTIYQFAN